MIKPHVPINLCPAFSFPGFFICPFPHGVHRLKGDSDLLHIPDTNSALSLRDARARNHHYRLRGDLGDGARAFSLRATTYRPVACGERTLITRLWVHPDDKR